MAGLENAKKPEVAVNWESGTFKDWWSKNGIPIVKPE